MPALISRDYLEQQRRLHGQGTYGTHGAKWAGVVANAARALRATSVLDYGCGRGDLVCEVRASLPPAIRVAGYDPAVDRWTVPPQPADLVVCLDVLEHVEPDRLDGVLDDLARLTQMRLLVVVATRCADKWLPDGRNAHLTVAQPAWWEARLRRVGWTPAERVKTPIANPALEWLCLLRPSPGSAPCP